MTTDQDPYTASSEEIEIKESTEPQSNTLGIVSLVLGLLSVAFGPFTAIPGIIVGHIARSKKKNDGLALGGLIVSYLMLVLFIAMIVGFTLFSYQIREEFKEASIELQHQEGEMPAEDPDSEVNEGLNNF